MEEEYHAQGANFTVHIKYTMSTITQFIQYIPIVYTALNVKLKNTNV